MGLSDERREGTGVIVTALGLIAVTAVGVSLSFVKATAIFLNP